MANTYLNDATEVNVVKVTEVAAPHVSLNVATGTHSGITRGMFIGANSSWNATPADASAATFIPAMGVPLVDTLQSYTIESRTGDMEDERVDLYEDNITVEQDGITLVPGPIWLSSGGGITQNYPQGVGSIRQQLGWAISATEFVVNVQDAETIQT